MELIVIIIISIVVSFFNSFPVILQWMNNKPGEVFTGIAHSFADYFLYTAQMAQGAAGRWVYTDHLFTNEPTSPTWYYWFNVSLGHIGSWFGLSPFATYNGSLFAWVIGVILVWYFFTKTLYPTNRFLRLTSFLMILTTTSFFSLKRSHLFRLDGVDGVELLGQFWFSPAPVFNRLGGVPYHVFQTILFLFLCMAFAKKSRLVPFLSFVAGIVNPIQTLLFVLASRSIPAALLGGLGAFLTREEFTRQAVFAAAKSWELAQRVPNTIPVLLLSLGPILFFVLFGIKRTWQQENPLRTLLVFWGVLSFALFLTPIPRLLGLSPVRFLHPVPYAALAILGAEGLSRLAGTSLARRAILLTLYLLLTIPAISQQFIDRITPSRNPQLLMDTIYNHVPAPIAEALRWLKQEQVQSYSTRRVEYVHTSSSVVLTDPAIPIEILVPVFTGKPSFTGQPVHTLYPDVKEALRQEFFAGAMSDPNAFLADHRIGYIISSGPLPMFKQVYKNDTITIYTP